MQSNSATVLSDATNIAVVHLANRRFPGSVIQGDSLYSLLQIVRRSLALLGTGDAEEAIGELREMETLLTERLGHYEEVLTRHGFELPYSPSS